VPIDWILTPILTSDIGQQTKPADEICQGTDVMLPAARRRWGRDVAAPMDSAGVFRGFVSSGGL